MILIEASKVKEMYTHEISKGNASYLKLNKVSRDASKRHVIPPRHMDDVDMWTVWRLLEGRTLEIRNVLE